LVYVAQVAVHQRVVAAGQRQGVETVLVGGGAHGLAPVPAQWRR
jgi:hypothetical protein